MARKFLGVLITALAGYSVAQSTFTPARPPAIPLAVRSPYLNTWLQVGSDGGDGGNLAGEWPTFWQGAITGWSGLVRVDGQPYTWMGAPKAPDFFPSVTQDSFEYTATRSIFKQNVNNTVALTVTFLSPVTPNDLMRASLPFSYMQVEVKSLDGAEHDVQLYSDVSAEWVSGDRSAIAQWDYGVIETAGTPNQVAHANPAYPQPEPAKFTAFANNKDYAGWRSAVVHDSQPIPSQTKTPGPTKHAQFAQPTGAAHGTNNAEGIAYHKFYRQTQLALSETSDQTDFGEWYYLTSNCTGLTHQSGADVDVRSAFVKNGVLTNGADTNYRAISDSYPVFGFSINYGKVSGDSQSTLFGIVLAQDDAIQFEGASGNQTLPSLWKSYFDTDLDAISWAYNDFETVGGLCTDFDGKVKSDSAAAAGDDYATITTLAVRQAFGALQLVGTPDTPYLFLKEISSDGNINTVDVIFPMHPILIYTNPELLKLLLEPLFINQEAGYWPQAFSIHDIGSHYPNATGHNDGNAEQQPLEECGNMIIMALGYAHRTDDNDWLTKHYKILKQWNEYLVEEALIPADQISTDDFAGSLANQTNLALKGIVGIEAMAQIANRTGNTDDAANFTSIAHDYITKWQDYGINKNANPPHTTLSYGDDDSWGILYNLWGDRYLGLDLVPQSVYDMQSTFYPTVFNKYGVPLDTRHEYTKSDWEIFMAAISSDDTKNKFISAISAFIKDTPTNYPCTDLYDTNTADFPDVRFLGRPVVGGFFAILALP